MSDQSWQASAACSIYTTHLFHSDRSGIGGRMDRDEAKAICASCSVLAECAKDAIENVSDKYGDQYGIRGGMTAQERSIVRRGMPNVCRNGHDLTAPDARAANRQCRKCRADTERAGAARRKAAREAAA